MVLRVKLYTFNPLLCTLPMVFGWGKKKKEPEKVVETTVESIEREITLGEIEKILKNLQEIRTKTLIAEAESFKNKMIPKLSELRDIAIQLEKDDLKIDDIDKHLKTIVERGKKQVISIIKEETSTKITNVKTIDDALSLNGQINRALKRIGDVLGRQSRVIHLFAKKYAGKLKEILTVLQDDKDTVQTIINNHKKLQDGILEIKENISRIKKSQEILEKRTKRISDFENSLKDFEEKTNQISLEIEKIKNSDEYANFLQIQEKLQQLEPEKHNLKREINDQFTKISRPLGKYEYVSSMDKEQKELLKVLVENPFNAISSEQKNNIITILQSVKKGVISGSVSVKDTDKSIQFLDETTELLDSLIQQKANFTQKEQELQKQLDAFDMNNLKTKQSELQKAITNHDDAKSKIRQFQDEISEAKNSVPKLTMNIENTLREVSSTKYTIKIENS